MASTRRSMRGRAEEGKGDGYFALGEAEWHGDDESGLDPEEDVEGDARREPRAVYGKRPDPAERQRQERVLKEMRRLMPGSRSHARSNAVPPCSTTCGQGATGETGGEGAGGSSADENKPRLRRRSSAVSYREPSIREVRRSPSPGAEEPGLRVGDWLEVEVGAWERIDELDTGEVVWLHTSTAERKRDEPGAAWQSELEWRPAQVREVLAGGRFSVVINNDKHFIEEYGPADEGKEWRKATARWGGLKRSRKSVEHYQPEARRARAADGDDRSLQVGPFRMGGAGRSSRGRRTGADGSRGLRRLGASDARRGRRGAAASSDESTTNNSEEEFEHRKKRSEARLRGAIRPVGGRGAAVVGEGGARLLGPGVSDAASRGDVQPMAVEAGGGWDKVGGLDQHVRAIKEMVLMPMLYPEVFSALGVTPPRGVLLHGPPGTGKTLVARALAQSCCGAGQPVSFFMRKGADVLSKWVGEAEKQLRLLFEEATRLAPSIIFFDEIDGLAPIRSSKQDYIHASIVSTLLALMDGLDSRGQVILIGATNRIDSLDAALRRPGRFDRELQFALPAAAAREQILRIHTSAWQPPLPPPLLSELATRTHGFCGADLKALCAEAALRRLRAEFPQAFEEEERYVIDVSSVAVVRQDFLAALAVLTPASHRSVGLAAAPLPPHLEPLLAHTLQQALAAVGRIFPPLGSAGAARSAFRGTGAGLCVDVGTVSYPAVCRPRLLLHGAAGNGQTPLAAALLHALEHCHLYSLDLASLAAAGHATAAEACARLLAEACRTPPAVVMLPNADGWLSCCDATLFATLCSMLDALPAGCPLLFLGTSHTPLDHMEGEAADRMRALFPGDLLPLAHPPAAARELLFSRLVADARSPPVPTSHPTAPPPRKLRKAPPPPPAAPTAAELAARRAERAAREREMRACLREICFSLGSDKRFREWARPVDLTTEAGAEYAAVVGAPMELARLLARVNRRTVSCRSAFEAHLRRIVQCAEAFYGSDGALGASRGMSDPMRPIANVHSLHDEAVEMLEEIDPAVAAAAEELAADRARLGYPQADPASTRPLGVDKMPSDAPLDAEVPPAPAPAAAADGGAARRARAAGRGRSAPEVEPEVELDPPDAPPQAALGVPGAPGDLETGGEGAGPSSAVSAEAWAAWEAGFTRRAVAGTDGWSVGQLEELMVDLWGSVHAHQHEADKRNLQLGLERIVDGLAAAPADEVQ